MASASLDYNKFDELPELFWNKVDKTGNCWLWLGKKDDGYGRWSPPGEKPQYLVHRLSFAVLKEKIIDMFEFFLQRCVPFSFFQHFKRKDLGIHAIGKVCILTIA